MRRTIARDRDGRNTPRRASARQPRRGGPRRPKGVQLVVGQWRKWLERFKLHRYARRQPVILINGLSEQPESWFRNLPYWRRYFDVYTPNVLVYDGPGLHRRIDTGEPVSVDFLVEQLHHYLSNFVQ